MRHWKVGELAGSTGLSVRTLHHYDAIGLLSPSHRSGSGHRLYAEGDLARLQQVVSLRSLGLPLEEIRAWLDRRGVSLPEVITLHAARLREQIEMQRRLVDRLEAVAAGLRSAGEVSAEELLWTIEGTNMTHQYFTPEQLEEIRQRGEQVGQERIRQVEAEWPELIAAVRAEMEKGTDPADPQVQALARRWKGLVDEFTGGNPEIARSVRTMYENEPQVRARAGLDPALFEYVGRANAAAKAAG